MLLIALTDGRNIRATRATPSGHLFEIIEEGGRKIVVTRDDVAGIGETSGVTSQSTETITNEHSPDLLLLARQALNLSSYFMDLLIGGREHADRHDADEAHQMHTDAENICNYFDRR